MDESEMEIFSFVLEKAGDEPPERQIRLYRAMSLKMKSRTLRERLRENADLLETALDNCQQLLLNFKARNF